MVNGVLFCTKSKWRETKTYQQRWTNCCWLVLFIKTDGQKLSLQLLQELCRMRKDFSAFPIQYAGHQLVMIMVGVISALIFSCGKATVGTSHSKKSHNDFHPCFTLYISSLSTGTMDITRWLWIPCGYDIKGWIYISLDGINDIDLGLLFLKLHPKNNLDHWGQ